MDCIIGYFAPRYTEKRIQARRNINTMNHQEQIPNIQKGRRVISSGIKLTDIIEEHSGNNKYDHLINLAKRAHDTITPTAINKDQFSD